MRTRRRMKKGGVNLGSKSLKAPRAFAGPEDVRMDTGMKKKSIVRKADVDAIFVKEKARVESSMFEHEFADDVIAKFRKFLDKLEARDEKAFREENEEERSEISIAKMDIATRLVEAFGTKAKTAPKAKAPEAFDEDLLSMLTGMKL